MNFKDIYKSANDNISGNKILIDSIFEKAQKKQSFFVVYMKQISVCAAAAVLILTVGFLPMLNNPEDKNTTLSDNNVKSELSDVSVASKDENDNKDISDKENFQQTDLADTERKKDVKNPEKNENKDKQDKEKSIAYPSTEGNAGNFTKTTPHSSKDDYVQKDYSPITNHDNKSSILQSQIQLASVSQDNIDNNYPLAGNVVTEESAYSYSVPEDESSSITHDFKPKASSGGSAAGGGGGGGGARSSRSVTLTSEKYFDYLGLDINFVTKGLPDGMTFSIPENVEIIKDNNNNYLSDYGRFVALDNNNPDKIITVSTTKIDTEAKDAFESGHYEIIVINNHKVAVSNSESYNKAYFSLNNVWFSVDSANITGEEFNDYIGSLLN